MKIDETLTAKVNLDYAFHVGDLVALDPRFEGLEAWTTCSHEILDHNLVDIQNRFFLQPWLITRS
jgi:hypothetical protein